MIRKLIPACNILATIILIIYSVKFLFFNWDESYQEMIGMMGQHLYLMIPVCFYLLVTRLIDYFFNQRGAFEDSSPTYFGFRMTRAQLCLMLSFIIIATVENIDYRLIGGDVYNESVTERILHISGSLANHLTAFYLILYFTSKRFLSRFPPLSYGVSILICGGIGYLIPKYLGWYFLLYVSFHKFPISQLNSIYGFAGVNLVLLISVVVFIRIFCRIRRNQTAQES